nr:hypothetical protein [uncultured Methylibium sp.]
MPTFFETPARFRTWLEQHGRTEPELVVGFYKRGSGRPSMTWSESVDEALCFGWIDGVRTRIDDDAYKIRFTPRKPTSTWSAINIDKVHALQAAGRMTPAGLEALRGAARTSRASTPTSRPVAPSWTRPRRPNSGSTARPGSSSRLSRRATATWPPGTW